MLTRAYPTVVIPLARHLKLNTNLFKASRKPLAKMSFKVFFKTIIGIG
jgi:hypothetical protein